MKGMGGSLLAFLVLGALIFSVALAQEEKGQAAEEMVVEEQAVKVTAAAAKPEEGQPPAAEAGPKVSYLDQVGRKFSRAATNVARAGTEFCVQPIDAKRQSGKDISMLWPGLGEAFGMFLTRLLGGTIELVTCAVPFPNGWQPLLDE